MMTGNSSYADILFQGRFVSSKNCEFTVTLLRILPFFPLAVLAACAPGQAEENRTSATSKTVVKADRIVVDKSDRTLILYKADKEIHRYTNIRFGDAPVGHKQFEGDEKTPEGSYTINGRNPKSAYTLSLRISYPNAADRAFAKSKGKSPGGDIFIHGQPNRWAGPAIARDWTDGCIALSNDEIALLWKQVPDGTKIEIRP
jgi:murein L,D-transpeptidase YafK